MTELELEALRDVIEQTRGEFTVQGAGAASWFLHNHGPAILAALERIPELERELAQCSDELGQTRMGLNDEMYAREAAEQNSDLLQGLERDICRLGAPLRAEAPPLLRIGPMGVDGALHVYTEGPGGAYRRGLPAEEVSFVAALLLLQRTLQGREEGYENESKS